MAKVMFNEQECDLWDMYDANHYVCITTNGVLNRERDSVMGKGSAREAASRFIGIQQWLGKQIMHYGNVPFKYPHAKIISFPTKHDWHVTSDLNLIMSSFQKIIVMFEKIRETEPEAELYSPRPGCGSTTGQLDWESKVKPALIQRLYHKAVPWLTFVHLEGK